MPASTSATTAANGRSSRSGGTTPKSLVLVFKVSSNLLRRFPGVVPGIKESNPSTPSKDKERSSPASSSADPAVLPSSVDNASDTASTPAPGANSETPRRRGVPGPKPGAKRGSDVMPKPRGKPGPKKKSKLYVPTTCFCPISFYRIPLASFSFGLQTLTFYFILSNSDDGTYDHPPRIPHSSHKLGPKANTGAINAGLRALDRSGAPCRRWERKPLQLKSFTGVVWQLPTWRTPKTEKIDENNENKEVVVDAVDNKANNNTESAILSAIPSAVPSAIPSEKSNSGDGDVTPFPSNMESSPAISIGA